MLRSLLALHTQHRQEAELHAQQGMLLQAALSRVMPTLLAQWAPVPGEAAIRLDLSTGRVVPLRFRRYIGEAMVFEGGPRPTTVIPGLKPEDQAQPYIVLPQAVWELATQAA